MGLLWGLLGFVFIIYLQNYSHVKKEKELAKEKAEELRKRISDLSPSDKVKACALMHKIAPSKTPFLRQELEVVCFELLMGDCLNIIESEATTPEEEVENMNAIRREFDL